MIGWWVCCSRRLWLVRWWRARGDSSACSACSLTLFVGCLSLFSFLPSHYLHHHIFFFCFRCFFSLRFVLLSFSFCMLFLFIICVLDRVVLSIWLNTVDYLISPDPSSFTLLPFIPPLAHSLSFSHSSFAFFSRKAIIVALTLWGRG